MTVPPFAAAYKHEDSAAMYGAPDEKPARGTELDYSEPVPERVERKPSRSRWDMLPGEAARPPPPPPPVPPIALQARRPSASAEPVGDAKPEAMDVDEARAECPSHSGPTAEAQGGAIKPPPAAPCGGLQPPVGASSEAPKPTASPSVPDRSAFQASNETAELPAEAANGTAKPSAAPPRAASPPVETQDQPAQPPAEAPRQTAVPLTDDPREAAPPAEEPKAASAPVEAPQETAAPPADTPQEIAQAVLASEHVGAPSHRSTHTDAPHTDVAPESNEPMRDAGPEAEAEAQPTDVAATPLTPAYDASASSASPEVRPTQRAEPSGANMSLDEDAMEQQILTTERTLQAAEHAKDAAAVSAPVAPDAARPIEQAAAATDEPAVVEATAQTVHTLAKQLVAAHPLRDEHVEALFRANRRVVASLADPAVLAYTRAPAAGDAEVPNAVLQRDADERHAARAAKVAVLRAEYRRLHAAWKTYCEHLDRVYERRELQRRAAAHPGHEDEAAAGHAAFATPVASRTSRRGAGGFGDAVRSEAEFLEILASLENAEMQDPMTRAARTAAAVPDMEVRVPGDPAHVDHDNGFVADFARVYFSRFDPDVWSEDERRTFTKRYALYPKQFGRIARGLPHKTMQQCVVYYYLHKHAPGHDFKALSTRSRERKRKTRRPKKAKGSALMADIAAGSAKEPDAEAEPEEKTPKRRDDERRTPAGSATKRARATPKRAAPEPEDASDAPPQTPAQAQAQAEMERDLAAAEALEALAGITPVPKKKARRARRDDDAEPRSRSRGPHWSMTERAEFLRLLALHGKDWAALATAFPAKTAAQTRNFFARHASESSHFQAAAALALENATRPYAERSAAAVEFVNAWYASLPEDVQASVEGWPADPAAFLAPPPTGAPPARDDDETDEEAAAGADDSAGAAPSTPAPPPQPVPPRRPAPPAPVPAPASGPPPMPAHAPPARPPEPWPYAYAPPARPMPYREGYPMYAYAERYRPEYAAYRDERSYARPYVGEPMYADRPGPPPPAHDAYERGASRSPLERRAPPAMPSPSPDRTHEAYARGEYLPGRAEPYADPAGMRRPLMPPGPSLGYFHSPRPERWRGP